MIYGTLESGWLVIGLSKENVERLQLGKPIFKSGARIEDEGLPPLLILYGETEEVCLEKLRKHSLITSETTIVRQQ